MKFVEKVGNIKVYAEWVNYPEAVNVRFINGTDIIYEHTYKYIYSVENAIEQAFQTLDIYTMKTIKDSVGEVVKVQDGLYKTNFGNLGYCEWWFKRIDNTRFYKYFDHQPMMQEKGEIKMYTYYTVARPAMPGTIPSNGLESIEDFGERRQLEHCQAWSKVEYSRELTKEEIYEYELSDNRPNLRSVEIPDVDDLVMDVFAGQNSPAEQIELERELEKKEKKNFSLYRHLFEMLVDGEIDFFYYDCKNMKPYKFDFLRYIYTMSVKEPGKIQKSCIWYRDGEEIPLSDVCRNTVTEFDKENELKNGVTIFYGKSEEA